MATGIDQPITVDVQVFDKGQDGTPQISLESVSVEQGKIRVFVDSTKTPVVEYSGGGSLPGT
jgi:hypothetical protein